MVTAPAFIASATGWSDASVPAMHSLLSASHSPTDLPHPGPAVIRGPIVVVQAHASMAGMTAAEIIARPVSVRPDARRVARAKP